MKASSLPCLHVADDGSITIPASVAAAHGLRPGMDIDVHVTKGGIWLRPDGFDPDQWWHWTPEWQEGEDEIDEDNLRGRIGQIYYSDEEFLAALAAATRG